MPPIADLTDAKRRLRRYLSGPGEQLPPATLCELETLVDSPSPIYAIAWTTELLYARRDELDQDGRDLVAVLAVFASGYGWHGLDTDGRGAGIAAAMGRKKPKDGDPEPAPRWAVPPPAPELKP